MQFLNIFFLALSTIPARGSSISGRRSDGNCGYFTRVGPNKLYPSGSQVKFRDDSAVMEPGSAVALDLRLDFDPPSVQPACGASIA